MRFPLVTTLLCLALVAFGCGSDDATTSQLQDTRPAAAPGSGSAKPEDDVPVHRLIGPFEQEGPFAAISGGKGDQMPSIDPADRPAPRKLLVRELEAGTGPAARKGDRVGVYYAGAVYQTGKVRYGGWPPAQPATFQLGFSTFGEAWEEGIEGMKVGGLREVIIPSHRLNGTGAVDYVIELVTLEPASTGPVPPEP